jgi:hypothetical protein
MLSKTDRGGGEIGFIAYLSLLDGEDPYVDRPAPSQFYHLFSSRISVQPKRRRQGQSCWQLQEGVSRLAQLSKVANSFSKVETMAAGSSRFNKVDATAAVHVTGQGTRFF